ncbi:7-carboxy-7-deazaguanine synthase QueE [Staphylococcus sp. EG-SA-6]|jgi:7-carboxy-7-deazaguanine synthase|uniref:7-carboxy-7-deazaguanine synthase n=2 Tax=Staphylococcus haemolyticus TaxID=1283 RepID=A0A2A1K9K1_STAHA|nr:MULTISPECIES: 7-carboxy-7-deazaguanine synthase QueE [Staphylococcus]KDP52965.1 7-cyano-7-deazaguanosine (preQ0) biosynthesis protein QueE [Staphylococcus aureus subsp. aureus CO-98]MBN4935254.1 7-carboxy-7-deazaguanine synthase QueE [Staphylococcus sp. EG-SA-6]MDU2097821.1 7-carboxy-7-deazaguanine synthase QueE [Staphylococcus sp.]AKC76889.1 7-cyano-7-deazaguanosine (preQ0) biosynthesis protein [Staphylococcus haemolyticus]AMW22767.1 7-carboxy-7-deazaguanine synthase [Staphylococcus haemol
MAAKIPVLEIFGPTIQGEGRVIGRKTMFVRTAGCDYRCSWCDSAFTWDGSAKEDIKLMTAEEIYNQLKKIGGDRFDHVTISGGNPALIKGIQDLVDLFEEKQIYTALETQGSKFQPWMRQINDLTISPKPPSSNMKPNIDILDSVIEQCIESTLNLKVVIFDDDDYEFAKMIHHRYPNIPFYLQVGNPYLDDDVDNHTEKLLSRYEALVDRVMASNDMNQVYVLPQLHTLLWSNKKGV